jgi:hypothetical protein
MSKFIISQSFVVLGWLKHLIQTHVIFKRVHRSGQIPRDFRAQANYDN